MREENKRRKSDETRSDQAHKMFERVFYGPETTDYKDIKDKETQVKGVDSIFTYNGRTYHCDEKAAVNWVGKHLKSFSMELTFIDRADKLADGWFVKESSKTDSYLFMWLDDVYEIALVMKQDIENYLERLGWNTDKLCKKAEKIRYGNDRKFGDLYENKCKFSFSYKIPEEPVNVLVPRKELVRMAVYTKKFPYEEEDKKVFGLK